MLLNFARHMLACCIFATGFILLQPDTARAQAVGQLSEKPIAIFYAKEIIRLSVARCDGSNATRTPFVSARIDMERWLAYPQDDPAGIAQMPHWLDSNAWWFPPGPIFVMENMEAPGRKPQSIMQRAFDLGGSQQFSLTLDADESGLLLQMSLGEALANHMLARMIDRLDESESSEAESSQE